MPTKSIVKDFYFIAGVFIGIGILVAVNAGVTELSRKKSRPAV